jgi:hypothetical protein
VPQTIALQRVALLEVFGGPHVFGPYATVVVAGHDGIRFVVTARGG